MSDPCAMVCATRTRPSLPGHAENAGEPGASRPPARVARALLERGMPSFLRLPLLPLLAFAAACGGAVTSPFPSGGASASDAGTDTGASPPEACTAALTVGPIQLLSGPGES